MSKKLTDALALRGKTIKNRVCIPPMWVPEHADEAGFSTGSAEAHYAAFARGGAGLIIQEATCVSPEGKLHDRQLGIWSDAHVEGLARIAAAAHAEGGVIIMQIHHAGVVGVSEKPLCPSAYPLAERGKTGVEMTRGDILRLQRDFISAGIRAHRAGYDGVELHGCHSYLISQFFNSRVNRRADEFADAMNFVAPILKGIREATGDGFIIGIRLGAFEPTLEDGIAHARALEKLVDFIDVSYGFSRESEPVCPEDWRHKDIVHAAGEIKKQVGCPVFAVNEIDTPEIADDILDKTGVDMVDVGRSSLVDPAWAFHALNGEKPGKCLHCKVCQWRIDPARCAGRILMNKH